MKIMLTFPASHPENVSMDSSNLLVLALAFIILYIAHHEIFFC